MIGGPRRKPCPGMGDKPKEILKPPVANYRPGRGICPTCDRDVIVNGNGKVGYHTSDFSENL